MLNWAIVEKFNPVYYLLFQSPRPMRLVNTITFFRVAAFPVFVLLLFLNREDIFKWLVLVSFLTDAIDGFLARKFKVISILGSRLDSLGDDLTILASFLGVIVFHGDFLVIVWPVIFATFLLFVIQLLFALVKYQKTTSFHSYGAKAAAILQGLFLCSLFFLGQPYYPLFYATMGVTALELIEEIIMVYVMPRWRADVRGLYWALKETDDNLDTPESNS